MKKRELKKLQKTIRTLLDDKYFYVYTNIEDGIVKWRVYYRNLPKKLYYSLKNPPLLTSEKNSIQDIFKLKRKFEEEKSKEAAKYVYEIMPFASWLGRKLTQIFNIFINLFVILWLIMYGVYISTRIFFEDSVISIAIAIIMILTAIMNVVYSRILSKKCRIIVEKFGEKFIQSKIRNMGLYFVNKIKI